MIEPINLMLGKKVYFASDFHLGAPDPISSRDREHKLVNWFNQIETDAAAIFLLGDLFDFWFEYKRAIPKGFARFQGKIADLTDKGIAVHIFTGNHDLWMFDYFETELGVRVHRSPIDITINSHDFMIGHGDGLGPGDRTYKVLKKIFKNSFLQWCFARIHPNLGIGLAKLWSSKSRIYKTKNNNEDEFLGDDEWLHIYCKKKELEKHRDYYVFGHRHLPLDLPVGESSRYVNLGEWINQYHFGVFDGESLKLINYSNGESN